MPQGSWTLQFGASITSQRKTSDTSLLSGVAKFELQGKFSRIPQTTVDQGTKETI
jgi:hypothetical protein